ncbi:MAG: YfhO family protein [Actinomycetota bacterium]
MSTYDVVLAALTAVAFLSAAGFTWVHGPVALSRRQAVAVGATWVAVVSAEFVFFGPYSYLGTFAEMDFTVLVQQYLVEHHGGGQFAHAFAGGNDVDALGVFTGQFLALDRVLLSVLPMWAVTGAIRVAQEALALAGVYLLCRRLWQSDRFLALCLGAIYSLSNHYFFKLTMAHGLAFALMPVLVLVFVARVGRPHYWWWVVGLSALHAISCTPTHSGPPVFAALAFAILLIAPKPAWKPMAAIAILLVAVLLNWHESLWGKMQLAPWAFRSSQIDLTRSLSGIGARLVQDVTDVEEHRNYTLWLALALLWWTGHPLRRRIAAVTLGTALGGTVVQNLPWAAIGLKAVAAVDWERVAFSMDLFVLLAMAAAHQRKVLARPAPRVGMAAMAGLAAAALVATKVQELGSWVSLGGLPVIEQGRVNIARAGIPADKPVRVVSMPYRLPADLAVVAGLDTLDGTFNLNLSSLSYFWLDAVLKHPSDAASSYLSLATSAFDDKCCASYDLGQHADLAMLRLMNVGYVLSVLPLTGEGVTQVSGPGPEEMMPTRRVDQLSARLAGYLREMVRTPPVRVYSIGEPLPRVYAATAVVATELDPTTPEFFDLLRREGPARKVLVAAGRAGALPASAAMTVRRYALPADAVTAEVEAPSGGTLVVAIPFTPWWTATVDGRPVDIVPVNAAQMAVSVPAGGRSVELRYHRPTLREKLVGGRR